MRLDSSQVRPNTTVRPLTRDMACVGSRFPSLMSCATQASSFKTTADLKLLSRFVQASQGSTHGKSRSKVPRRLSFRAHRRTRSGMWSLTSALCSENAAHSNPSAQEVCFTTTAYSRVEHGSFKNRLAVSPCWICEQQVLCRLALNGMASVALESCLTPMNAFPNRVILCILVTQASPRKMHQSKIVADYLMV